MQTTLIKPNKNLESLLGSEVGYVRLNKEFVHHNAQFECAAWWEDSKVETGIYPLILMKNSFTPNELRLQATFTATVVDDFFPSTFGGNLLSHPKKNLGSPRKITKYFDLIDSIEKTGQSSSSDFDLVVNPMLWDEVIKSAHDSIADLRRYMNSVWAQYDQNDRYALNAISYCASNIAILAKAIDRVIFIQSFTKMGSNPFIISNNISWVQEAA